MLPQSTIKASVIKLVIFSKVKTYNLEHCIMPAYNLLYLIFNSLKIITLVKHSIWSNTYYCRLILYPHGFSCSLETLVNISVLQGEGHGESACFLYIYINLQYFLCSVLGTLQFDFGETLTGQTFTVWFIGFVICALILR